MTITQRSVLAAIVAAGITGGGCYWHGRQQWRELHRLRGDNARLHGEVEARVRANKGAVLPAAPMPTPPVASIQEIPARAPDYRNEGNATPLATLQTLAWACDQGDVASIRRLIFFDDAARTKTLALIAAMPDDTRRHWDTPETMAATLLVDAGMRSPYPHADVLLTATVERIADGRVKVRLAGIRRADSEYQRTPDGWKYAITPAMVDAYVAANPKR